MKKVILWFVSGCLLAACASTHPGQMATAIQHNPNMDISISGESVDFNSEDSFQLIDVTFENKTDRWVKINSAQVVLNSPSNVSVVTGDDLRSWGQAMNFKLKMQAQNDEVLQNSLIIGGALTAAAGSGGRSSGAQAIGAAAMLGGMAWATADVMNASYQNANRVDVVPDNHLSRPFSIPGKMFMRRWVLLNKPSGMKIRKLILEVETVTGDKETYEINNI